MTIGKRDFLNDYDMASPELANDWDRLAAEFHEKCPVARSNIGEGYWVFNKHSDVTRIASDWRTFSSATGFQPDRPKDMPWLPPEESDPPFHDTLRAALNRHFGPGAIRRYEQDLRRHANILLDEILAVGTECDFLREYANSLPARFFCEVIAHMPTEDLPFLQENLEKGLVGPVEGRSTAFNNAYNYIGEFLKSRPPSEPRDDLVQTILDLEFEGFGWSEKVGTLTNLTRGGVGTTGFVLACAVHYLAENPEELERLKAHPDLMPLAVEEFVRYFAASPHDGRRVTCPVEVAGVKLKPGDYVILGYGVASRDPELVDNPNELIMDRPLPNRHVSFGWGVHRCIGAHLAKAVVRVGLEVFFERIASYRVPDGFTPTFNISTTRVLESLPLILEPRM